MTYEQLDIFSYLQTIITPVYNPVRDYAARGSGFVNGKKRIREFFMTHSKVKERADFLKNEYGIGGFGSPVKKCNYVHGGDHSATGHIIEYYDDEMNNNIMTITHTELAKTIDEMIKENEY